jgi:hypothetical protein
MVGDLNSSSNMIGPPLVKKSTDVQPFNRIYLCAVYRKKRVEIQRLALAIQHKCGLHITHPALQTGSQVGSVNPPVFFHNPGSRAEGFGA